MIRQKEEIELQQEKDEEIKRQREKDRLEQERIAEQLRMKE